MQVLDFLAPELVGRPRSKFAFRLRLFGGLQLLHAILARSQFRELCLGLFFPNRRDTVAIKVFGFAGFVANLNHIVLRLQPIQICKWRANRLLIFCRERAHKHAEHQGVNWVSVALVVECGTI